MTEIKDIAEEHNDFLDQSWAKFNQKSSKFSKLIHLSNTQYNENENWFSFDELKEAFFSLNTSKSPGYDDINFNVAKKYFGEINEPLKHLFNLSLENEIFPEKNENCQTNITFPKWQHGKHYKLPPNICSFLFF